MRRVAIALLVLSGLASLAPAQFERRGGSRGAPGMPRPGVGPGQGPRAPYLAESWEYWWFLNGEKVLGLRQRLCRLETPGEFSDFRGLDLPTREKLRDTLIAAVADSGGALQAECLMALAKTGDAAALPLLVEGAAAAGLDRRRAATLGLGVLGRAEAAEPLARLLADDDAPAEQRELAGIAAGLLGGSDAAELLRPILAAGAGNRTELLAGAIVGAGLAGELDLLDPVLALWRERGRLEPRVRTRLPDALARLGGDAAATAILEGLEDDDGNLRRSCALALGQVSRIPGAEDALQRLLAGLESEADVVTRNFLELSLGRLTGDRGLLHLSRQLVAPSGGALRGGFVAPRLSLDSAAKVPFAALGLGLAGDARAIRLLQDALRKEKKAQTAGALALALGLLQRPESASILEARLKKTKDPVQRAPLCLALGLVSAQGSRKALERLLREESDPELLPAVSMGLALMGHRAEATEILLQRVDRGRKTGRAGVLYCVGLIGDHRAVDPLIEVLQDERESDEFRSLAAVALGDLADRRRPRALAELSAGFNYTAEPSLLLWLFGIR